MFQNQYMCNSIVKPEPVSKPALEELKPLQLSENVEVLERQFELSEFQSNLRHI